MIRFVAEDLWPRRFVTVSRTRQTPDRGKAYLRTRPRPSGRARRRSALRRTLLQRYVHGRRKHDVGEASSRAISPATGLAGWTPKRAFGAATPGAEKTSAKRSKKAAGNSHLRVDTSVSLCCEALGRARAPLTGGRPSAGRSPISGTRRVLVTRGHPTGCSSPGNRLVACHVERTGSGRSVFRVRPGGSTGSSPAVGTA